MNTFKFNGISINDYEGNGKPLIFIHAYPLCSRMWDDQVSYFKDKFRVITYDIRGLGYSNELSDYQFTMEDLVNDLFSIMDEMKLGKANVCGLSVGGYILLRAIVRDSKRFSSVILADTKSEGEDNDSLVNRSNMIMDLKTDNKDKVLNEFLKKLISEESYKNEKLRSFIETMMSWMDVKGLCAVLMAIATRTSTFFELEKTDVPALIIAGKLDMVTPPVRSFYMNENLKNSVLNIIPAAGHLSNMEAPVEFNKAVEKFLLNLG